MAKGDTPFDKQAFMASWNEDFVSRFGKEFCEAVGEIYSLQRMKMVWFVPPLKSLSLGQGYRLAPGAKLRVNGFNTTGYKNWTGRQTDENNRLGENIYMGRAQLISPMEYLKLPSHLSEMARVDKFAKLWGSTRDDPKGLLQDVRDGNVTIIDNVRVFVGCWTYRDDWLGLASNFNPAWWYNHMGFEEVGFYGDGAIVRYSGGLRAGEYWGWNSTFNFTTGKVEYNPKLNPRSSDDVEAILKRLSSGNTASQPTNYPTTSAPKPSIPQADPKPKPTAKNSNLKTRPTVVSRSSPKKTTKPASVSRNVIRRTNPGR